MVTTTLKNVTAEAHSKDDTSETLSPTVQLAKLAFEKLTESGIDRLTSGIERTAKVAEKGVIPFLLGTGVLLEFSCLALKIEIEKHQIANLTTTEFVTVFVVGALLILAGAGLRTWTYASEHSLRKEELGVRLRILELTAGVAETGMRASSAIATANAEIAKNQLATASDAAANAIAGVSKKDPVRHEGLI